MISEDALKVDTTDYLFVLAGSMEEALYFARANGVTDRSRVVSVNSSERLRGISGEGRRLYCYGTFYNRRDYRETIGLARARGFWIVVV